MSGTGAPQGLPDGRGVRVAVVTASWHVELCDQLRARAVAALRDTGADLTHDIRVPGALEIGVVAKRLLQSNDVDAVVALGVVIRGGTPHFAFVCATTSTVLADIAIETVKPVGNGVLTCDTVEQARDRSGFPDSLEDKGYQAAVAAVATVQALRQCE